jgi:hypothetical protein
MNKGELRTHLIALLNRNDLTNALADTFIDQAVHRITRILRIPSMEKTQTYDVANDVSGVSTINLPIDFIEPIDVYSEGKALVRLPLHEMVEAQKSNQQGTPVFFTRVQGTYLVHPKPSTGTIVLNYYAAFSALTSDSSTNTLTTLGPDLLIYTSLGYAADYFLDERGPQFEAKASQFLAEIQQQADAAEQNGGLQIMRPSATYTD